MATAHRGDYDGDGDLDLHVQPYSGRQSVSQRCGGHDAGGGDDDDDGVSNSYGSAWGDYDGDGDLDLSVGIHGAQ